MFLLVQIVYEPLQSCSSQNVSDKNVWRSAAKFTLSNIYIIMPNCYRNQLRLTKVGYERNISWNKLWFFVRVNTPGEAGDKSFSVPSKDTTNGSNSTGGSTKLYLYWIIHCSSQALLLYAGSETLYKLNSYKTDFKSCLSLVSLVHWDLNISHIHPGNLLCQK